MKRLYLLLVQCVFFAVWIQAQENVAQFVIWKPYRDSSQQFEDGYKRHLQWHIAHNDNWNWFGWYFISGERYGQFIDATMDRQWSDFDHAVSPHEDRADNIKNVVPYASLQTVFKAVVIPSASAIKNVSNSNYLRFIQIQSEGGDIEPVLEELYKRIQKQDPAANYITYRIADGDNLGKYLILIGYRSWEQLAKSEDIYGHLNQIEKERKLNLIKTVSAEMLRYRADMSLIH